MYQFKYYNILLIILIFLFFIKQPIILSERFMYPYTYPSNARFTSYGKMSCPQGFITKENRSCCQLKNNNFDNNKCCIVSLENGDCIRYRK